MNETPYSFFFFYKLRKGTLQWMNFCAVKKIKSDQTQDWFLVLHLYTRTHPVHILAYVHRYMRELYMSVSAEFSNGVMTSHVQSCNMSDVFCSVWARERARERDVTLRGPWQQLPRSIPNPFRLQVTLIQGHDLKNKNEQIYISILTKKNK